MNIKLNKHFVIEYKENNKCHRDNDKPARIAIVYPYIFLAWMKNNRIHRDNAPAVIYSNGTKEYWTNGNRIK